MRKGLVVVFLLLTVTLLVGCSSGSDSALDTSSTTDAASPSQSRVASDEPMTMGVDSEGGKSLLELIESLPPEDRELALESFQANKTLYIYDGRAGTILVQAGDKRVHPDPAADADFIEGRADSYDRGADTVYWDQQRDGTPAGPIQVGPADSSIDIDEGE